MAEVTAAETEAQAEAAFVGATFTDTPPVEPAKVVEEAPVDPATPVAVAPAPVVEKPQYVRLTKQDWDNAKASLGKVSALESRLAKFEGTIPKTEQLAQQALDKASAQTGIKLDTSKGLAKLAANFPELAADLMEDLNEVFQSSQAAVATPAPVDVNAAVEKVLADREIKALAKAYPDWSEIVGRPPAEGAPIDQANPFRQWLAKQPADYQKEISETDSAADVRDAITKFKASQSAAPAPKPDRAAARRAVIEDAVTPRADGNPPPLNPAQSAEDAFLAAGKSYRERRVQ